MYIKIDTNIMVTIRLHIYNYTMKVLIAVFEHRTEQNNLMSKKCTACNWQCKNLVGDK